MSATETGPDTVTPPAAPAVQPAVPAPAVGRARTLLLLAIAAAAFNLRPAVAALGPMLDRIWDSLHMSAAVAGVLTALPSLCFAVVGLLAPALARRIGPAATVCAGMGAVALGLAARALAPGSALFLLLSAVALAGIAVTNVLMPVLVKRYFPDRVGPVTGLYSMSLALGTSVSAAFAVPLTSALGGSWRVGLAVWSLAAVAALLLWLAQLALARRSGLGETAVPAAERRAAFRISRSRTAWALTLFFGLQSTAAYAIMGWMPQMFQDSGISATESGVLLAVTMLVSAPLSFVIPSLAARRPDQGRIVLVLAGCGMASYAGLAFAPAAAPWLWAVLAGFSGSAFPLLLTMIGLRARSAEGVARLSAFCQGLGYLISVPGPILIGVLYQREHGWYGPLALLAVLLVAQAVVGLRAARPRQIEDEV
ncbi:MFS transporter [Streptacidiphilus sp. PB12-B1b]|uniref:MFS transporter n=1 Tax=Streptacidiphilus sp. PB12-B1b TaxID=2705012 RepID=UPI0015FCDBCE|nr:MFS transporter [Streptacidiphilus sp. PB12-B1b]QMU78506.1 MFS transporter [Streptacidiphilus sp. PB12-B1b]